MKTKRRQELRQNELVHQLLELRDFVSRRWNYVAGVAVVVVLAVGVGLYWRHAGQQARADGLAMLAKYQQDSALSPSDRLDKLSQIASEYSNADVRLAALEATAREAMNQSRMIGRSPATLGDYEKLLKLAEDSYQQILREFPNSHPVVARAHLNLAGIAEDRWQFDKARQEYDAILKNPNLATITMYESIAAKRVATLAERSAPMVVLPALPKPTTTTATRPTTQPASQPGTRPAGA